MAYLFTAKKHFEFPFLNLPPCSRIHWFLKNQTQKSAPWKDPWKLSELVGWLDDQAYWQLAFRITWPMTQRWQGIQANDLTSQCFVIIWNIFLSQTHTSSRSEVIKTKKPPSHQECKYQSPQKRQMFMVTRYHAPTNHGSPTPQPLSSVFKGTHSSILCKIDTACCVGIDSRYINLADASKCWDWTLRIAPSKTHGGRNKSTNHYCYLCFQ